MHRTGRFGAVGGGTVYSRHMPDGPLAVILAAGQGTRMHSSVPKVLHRLGGRPLVLHAIDAAEAAGAGQVVAVVSPAQPEVRRSLEGRVRCVDQELPQGTGDAVRSVPPALREAGTVLVLSADVPLVRPQTLRRLLDEHGQSQDGRACTLLSVVPDDPSGMGRILRDDDGRVARILEEGDIPDDMVIPLECNAGVYVFEGARLGLALDRLSADNAQGEYYLTDVIQLLDGPVHALLTGEPAEAIGVNDLRQLAAAEAALRRRTLDRLMAAGVAIEDPATTYIDGTVRVAPDSVIRPLSTLRGSTVLGTGCVVGPMAQLENVRAGDRVVIGSSQLEDCALDDDVRIGAYCRVRPGSVLGSGVELGTHAEVKNSTVGAASRIGHFSCVLDTDVGRDVNIGAGTVTANYDGRAKHRTTIGDRVFVGTNSTLVAPVRLGDGCYIGAGSFVDADVPPGALAVGRARQRIIEGWAARRGRVRA